MISLFVDNLTNIDFSYLHSEEGLIGETFIVDVELTGSQDDQGMLLDFSKVKKQIKKICDETLDHSLVIPGKSKQLDCSKKNGRIDLEFKFSDELVRFSGPIESISIINELEINIKTCQHFLEEKISEIMPSNIKNIQINLRLEEINSSFYRYSHGLKKHDGNCQRIAHGHRSRIEVYDRNNRVDEAERLIANIWDGRYIATKNDLLKETVYNDVPYYQFSYKSSQGDFYLELATDRCYLIESDSTVESIAEYLEGKLAGIFNKSFKIKAYEGLNKGAVFHSREK